MRICRTCAGAVLLLACLAFGQQPTTKDKANRGKESSRASAETKLKDMLESNVRAEWDAFKKKDKKAYSDLLADDFVAVEDDGEGERNKIHAVNEINASNIYNYSLAFFKLVPLAPDVAFVRYEITMEFPPKAQIRYSRVYVSELWLKHDGQWKERHHQETRVK